MERAAYIIYLIMLLLSVLLFGAMHTYMYTLVSLGVLLASLLLVLKGIKKDYRKGTYQFGIQKTSLNFLFVGLLVFLVFQLLPVPQFIIQLLSPEAAVVTQKSWPGAAVVEGKSTFDAWHSLAVYLYPTRVSLIRWTVYGLFFFGMVHVLNSGKRIRVLIYFILAIGCFEAIYGLMQAYSGDPHVLWKRMGSGKRVSGTYINDNHFAGLMEMGLLLAVAFALGLAELKRNLGIKSKEKSLKSKLSVVLSGDQQLQKRILILFAGIVMGIGLIFSASRGGIVSAIAGLLCLWFFMMLRRAQRRTGIILAVFLIILSIYAVNIGLDSVLGRFGKIEPTYERRGKLRSSTLEMFSDYKVAGIGVGNFQYAFPKYQPVTHKKSFVRYAHNDWAQFFSEAGIVGMGLLLAGMCIYIFSTIRLWRKRSDPFAVSLGILPLPVMAALAAHSFYEFNLHIPANFLVLVAIMAIGYAALHLERHHRRDVMTYRYYDLPLKYRGGVVLVLIFALIGWSGYWSIRHFMAEAYCNTVPNSTLNRDQNPPLEELVKAIEWDSSNAEYWYKLAERIEAQSSPVPSAGATGQAKLKAESAKGISHRGTEEGVIKEGEKMGGLEDEKKTGKDSGPEDIIGEILRLPSEIHDNDERSGFHWGNLRMRIGVLEKSVELNPFDAQYHLQLGWEYAHQWKEKDYHTKWLPAADISMERAAYFAGVKNPHLHQELGNYWTMRSKSVYPNNPLHHEAWAKACWHYRKAQSIERGAQSAESKALKRMKEEIRAYVWNVYPDEAYVEQVMVSSPPT